MIVENILSCNIYNRKCFICITNCILLWKNNTTLPKQNILLYMNEIFMEYYAETSIFSDKIKHINTALETYRETALDYTILLFSYKDYSISLATHTKCV